MLRSVNRREFLNRTTLAGASFALGSCLAADKALRAAEAEPSTGTNKIGAFTKSFQDLAIPQVCQAFHQMGLDGLDLTVRPGGHIEPVDAPHQLPLAAAAARDAGTEILFLTTAITDADDQADRLLASAAEIGLDRVKLGYYRYTQFGGLAEQMSQIRKRLSRVARMAAKHEVLPCVHIHSGAFVPSHGTQLYQLLQDFSPQEIGAYVDPLHMTVEGGGDGWRQGLDLLAPWIALAAVKNFVWKPRGRDKHGQMRWETEKVPLADGVCPLPEFVTALKELGYKGTYSLHSEYKGRRSFEDLDTAGCLQQTAEDLKYFRGLLGSA